MTSFYFHSRDTCLIRVKAQVMTREDGGWVPVEEGGYSVVGIYKMDGANLGNRIAYKIVGIFVATQKVSYDLL